MGSGRVDLRIEFDFQGQKVEVVYKWLGTQKESRIAQAGIDAIVANCFGP